MFHLAVEEKQLTLVADTILDAWQTAHDIERGRASALVGPDSVVIFVEDALSPAERSLAADTGAYFLLEEYAKALLHNVCRDEAPRVASISPRPSA